MLVSRFSKFVWAVEIFTWFVENWIEIIRAWFHHNYRFHYTIEFFGQLFWMENHHFEWMKCEYFAIVNSKNARNSVTIAIHIRFLGLPLTSTQVMAVVIVAHSIPLSLSLSFLRSLNLKFSPFQRTHILPYQNTIHGAHTQTAF